MFADLMNFDNLRRNIREFEAIIEINFATDGQAVLGKSSLLISLLSSTNFSQCENNLLY